jgi:hypothetical protein
MNFATLIAAMAKKKFMPTPQVPHPARTPAPLRASQGSALEIEIIPMILAKANGGLIGDVPTDHTVVAVGQFTLFDGAVRYYHIYLSGLNGGFLSIGMRGTAIIETRLYRLYTEVNPSDSEEWAFWLDSGEPAHDEYATGFGGIPVKVGTTPAREADGYIGMPVMNSLDADGSKPFNRSWGSGDKRIEPFTPIETVVDLAGDYTRLHHRMMHYTRPLTDKIAEHLLVSAVAEDSIYPSGVILWLGMDVDPGELKVFPATDTPAFP